MICLIFTRKSDKWKALGMGGYLIAACLLKLEILPRPNQEDDLKRLTKKFFSAFPNNNNNKWTKNKLRLLSEKKC